jgi:hypothetical protein
VSCNASGDNRATPSGLREQPPTLDPALSNFVDRYRAALASGAATEVGRGEVDGREVIWIRFPGSELAGRVAIDATTFKPLRVETPGTTYRVRLAETVAYDPSIFRRPRPAEPQFVGGGVTSETEVSPKDAAARLGGTALWLGREWNGMRLDSVTHQQRAGRHGDEPAEISTIAFTYAPVAAKGTVAHSSQVAIYETTMCLTRVGWSCTPRDPGTGTVLGLPLGPDGWIGLVRREDLYVSIWNVHPTRGATLLDIARALEPLSADR